MIRYLQSDSSTCVVSNIYKRSSRRKIIYQLAKKQFWGVAWDFLFVTILKIVLTFPINVACSFRLMNNAMRFSQKNSIYFFIVLLENLDIGK